MSNFAWGFFTGIVVMSILLGVVLFAIPDNRVSNNALNDPKYKIDTIVKIHNGDTTYTYKFARKQK